MHSFNYHLLKEIEKKQSHLCVGLDINPEGFANKNVTINDLKTHTEKVISATQDLAVAFKPNLGFYERWGSDGFKWLEETMELFEDNTIVIGDAKRGDIGNTADQYAISLFDHFGFDAVTINPYMGVDSIYPFIKNTKKGAFILCKTSNPSSINFQNLKLDGSNLYEMVAKKCFEWNEKENIGLVVGATAPEEILNVRKIAPGLPLLIPGVGAQGGSLEKSMKNGNKNGKCLINVSRGIIFSTDLSEKSIRNSAKEYVDKMRECIDE